MQKISSGVLSKSNRTQEAGTSRRGLILLLTAIVVGLVVGLFFLRVFVSPRLPQNLSSEDKSSAANLPSLTPVPTILPTPSPTPLPERGDLRIRVLNGNGVVGAASKEKAFLEEKGYQVAEVGNADRYDYAATKVRIKKSRSNFVGLLEEDLSKRHKNAVVNEDLLETEKVDVVLIVGQK